MRLIEVFEEGKIYTAVYFDKEQKYHYIKRFAAEKADKLLPYLPEESETELIHISTQACPLLKIEFGGKHKDRAPEEIDVTGFIAVKGFKAKGKRLSNYTIKKVIELEPVRKVAEDNKTVELTPQESPDKPDTLPPAPDFKRDGDNAGKQMELDLG